MPDYTRPYQVQSAFIHSDSDLRGDLAIKPHLLGDESYERFSAEGGYYRDDTRGMSVRFLGLFDTVGSFSLPGNDNNEPFQLALAPSCAKMVLQLTASHEYRRNFPLTSILSRYPRPSKNFFQEAFPGAHSDVGGGYPLLAQHDKQGLAKHFGFPVNNSYNRELVKTARLVLPYTHFTAKDYSQQQIDKLVATAQQQWQPQCLQLFGQYGEVRLKGDILYYYRLQPVCCALAGLSLERMKQQGGIAGVAWNERAYQQSLPADYLSNKLVSELSEKVNSVAIGKVDHHLWSRAIESMDAHLVHRSHDTAVSHGYDSIVEELIHGVSKDSKGNLARNVWHND